MIRAKNTNCSRSQMRFSYYVLNEEIKLILLYFKFSFVNDNDVYLDSDPLSLCCFSYKGKVRKYVIMMSNVKLLAEHTDEIISLDYTVYCLKKYYKLLSSLRRANDIFLKGKEAKEVDSRC